MNCPVCDALIDGRYDLSCPTCGWFGRDFEDAMDNEDEDSYRELDFND